LPDLNLSIPEGIFQLPTINFPLSKFSIPEINVPSFKFGIPEINVPSFKFGIPDISIPSFKFDIPTIDIPEFKFDIPEINVPTPDVPDVPEVPELPDVPDLDINFGAVGLQSGGRVEQTGMAQVHRGELVADPDRLVRDLADAVDTATGGGGGGTMDTAPIERKLDTLHRDLQRLASAMDNMTIEADREVIGRVAQDGLRNGNTDTDPLA